MNFIRAFFSEELHDPTTCTSEFCRHDKVILTAHDNPLYRIQDLADPARPIEVDTASYSSYTEDKTTDSYETTDSSFTDDMAVDMEVELASPSLDVNNNTTTYLTHDTDKPNEAELASSSLDLNNNMTTYPTHDIDKTNEVELASPSLNNDVISYEVDPASASDNFMKKTTDTAQLCKNDLRENEPKTSPKRKMRNIKGYEKTMYLVNKHSAKLSREEFDKIQVAILDEIVDNTDRFMDRFTKIPDLSNFFWQRGKGVMVGTDRQSCEDLCSLAQETHEFALAVLTEEELQDLKEKKRREDRFFAFIVEPRFQRKCTLKILKALYKLNKTNPDEVKDITGHMNNGKYGHHFIFRTSAEGGEVFDSQIRVKGTLWCKMSICLVKVIPMKKVEGEEFLSGYDFMQAYSEMIMNGAAKKNMIGPKEVSVEEPLEQSDVEIPGEETSEQIIAGMMVPKEIKTSDEPPELKVAEISSEEPPEQDDEEDVNRKQRQQRSKWKRKKKKKRKKNF